PAFPSQCGGLGTCSRPERSRPDPRSPSPCTLPRMHALTITRQLPKGEPIASVIRFVADWPNPPAPGPGQALVRSLAAALNHLDLWVARGVPGLNLTYPRISGSDACAVVEAVGPDVPGDWV